MPKMGYLPFEMVNNLAFKALGIGKVTYPITFSFYAFISAARPATRRFHGEPIFTRLTASPVVLI